MCRHPMIKEVDEPRNRHCFLLIRDDDCSIFWQIEWELRKHLHIEGWNRDVATVIHRFVNECASLKVYDVVGGVDVHFLGWIRPTAQFTGPQAGERWPPTSKDYSVELVHQTLKPSTFPFVNMNTVGMWEGARRTTPFLKPALVSANGVEALMLNHLRSRMRPTERNNHRMAVERWRRYKAQNAALDPRRMTHEQWLMRVMFEAVEAPPVRFGQRLPYAGLVDGVMYLFDGSRIRGILANALRMQERDIVEALNLGDWIRFLNLGNH